MNFIVKGGPVMIPILLGSIVGLAIVLERVWFLWKTKINVAAFSERVFYYIRTGDPRSSIAFCNENIKYPLASIYKTGLERYNLSPQEIEKAMEGEGNNQALEMERYLGALATIVGIEPLLGFLGTITGLIKAFMSWEHAGANITVSALAAGIYEAMITTAAGLMIAIPLYIVYNYFIARIKLITQEWTDYSLKLVEVIGEFKRGGASRA
jgi:biopolymer transport protein ExbB